jgi:CubicO group peptidase (beta-lactamase class C family)
MDLKLANVKWQMVLGTTLILALLCSPYAVAQAAKTAEPSVSDATRLQGEPPPGPTDAKELEIFIDGLMAAHMQARNIPAATISVVKDGALFFAKGYGYADLEKRIPVDPDKTLFRPGSTSKLFTWTAVMQLVERGQLDLDADINDYLTEFKIPDTYPEPITMKHLLTHTPGFEDGALGFLFVESADEIVPLSDSLKAHVPWRVRSPGTYSSYSNYGTALAGLIVADVSKMPFNEYIEKNILEPLGMENSTFREPLPDRLAENMATGYKRKKGVYEKDDFELISNVGPAGALSSTAADMARFMIAHLQNGRYGDARILKEETAKQMHSQHYTLDPRLPGMAYGFYESRVNGQHIIGHAGDTTMFHSDLALFPELNMGIFVSYVTNGTWARGQLLKAFLDRYFPKPEETLPAAPADFQDRGQRLAGSYRFTRHNFSTLEKMAALTNVLSVSVTSDNTLLISGVFPEPSQYVEVEPLLFQQIDGGRTIAFKENKDGEITHMFFGMFPFMPTYRVPWYEAQGFSLALVGLGVLLCITTLVSAFYLRKQSKTAPRSSRWAVRLAAVISVLTLAFLVSFIAIIASSSERLMYGFPASLTAALVLPIVTSVLAVGTTVFVVLAWKERWWTLVRRLHYSLFAITSLALVWFYFHWNILGFKY